ncbi:hypothetical protein V8B55DRAFT_1551302, partial [Mucor lusitanicus]
MAKSCTDCGLLLQVFVGGASLKGLTESDVMQVMNRCSIIKCSHVFKPQKQLGFCLLHFKDKTDAACFYHTYASKEIPICQSLGGLYVQEAVFNGVKATYDIASLQQRRYSISNTGCCCATATQSTTATNTWDPTAHHAHPQHIKTEPGIRHDIPDTNECMRSSLARLKREVIDDEKALKAKYEKIGLLERL